MRKTGETFELDGVWYVIVDRGKRLPNRPERVRPQPKDIPEEYIHADGMVHVCKNPRCPNLVPRSKNPGIPRLHCSRACTRKMISMRQDAKRDGTQYPQYGEDGTLVRVGAKMPQNVKAARRLFEEHLDGRGDRCPEASQTSNFHCPGRFNPNCYSKTKWERWKMAGPWPGACLIYAALKDNYHELYYAERAQSREREYTVSKDGFWEWKEGRD